MVGYGGYNAGAPTEQKGGFVSPNPFGSPETPSKAKQSQVQTLRPVTIKQILEATSQFPDAPLMVDQKEITQVVFLGRVMSCQVSSSNFQYTFDDGTGTIDVRQYTDNEDEESVGSTLTY